jgi:hypothetical protein
MPALRRAVLALACITSLSAVALVGTHEARAQVVTSKSLKVLVHGGTRTGPMSILPPKCYTYNGAVWCGVTVTNPAGPLTNVDGRRAGEPLGMLGCNFLTHSVAEARAIYAQLSDPATTSPVECGDTAAMIAPGNNASILQFDLTAPPRPTQSFTF